MIYPKEAILVAKNTSRITLGGLGTMGFGLPAAIGAKVARPDALVIDVDGDASFSMTLTEFSTKAQFNIGAKVIILNNVSVPQSVSSIL